MKWRIKMYNPAGFVFIAHTQSLISRSCAAFCSGWLCVCAGLIFSGFGPIVVGDYEILPLSCFNWRRAAENVIWCAETARLSVFSFMGGRKHIMYTFKRGETSVANNTLCSLSVCTGGLSRRQACLFLDVLCVYLYVSTRGLCLAPAVKLLWKCQSCKLWCVVLFRRGAFCSWVVCLWCVFIQNTWISFFYCVWLLWSS